MHLDALLEALCLLSGLDIVQILVFIADNDFFNILLLFLLLLLFALLLLGFFLLLIFLFVFDFFNDRLSVSLLLHSVFSDWLLLFLFFVVLGLFAFFILLRLFSRLLGFSLWLDGLRLWLSCGSGLSLFDG